MVVQIRIQMFGILYMFEVESNVNRKMNGAYPDNVDIDSLYTICFQIPNQRQQLLENSDLSFVNHPCVHSNTPMT